MHPGREGELRKEREGDTRRKILIESPKYGSSPRKCIKEASYSCKNDLRRRLIWVIINLQFIKIAKLNRQERLKFLVWRRLYSLICIGDYAVDYICVGTFKEIRDFD